jgi:hypothetical protein
MPTETQPTTDQQVRRSWGPSTWARLSPTRQPSLSRPVQRLLQIGRLPGEHAPGSQDRRRASPDREIVAGTPVQFDHAKESVTKFVRIVA